MIFRHKRIALIGAVSMLSVSVQIATGHQHSQPVTPKNSPISSPLNDKKMTEQNSGSKISKNELDQSKSSFKAVFDLIFGSFYREVKPAISRSEVCAIAPGLMEKENRIFSSRPLFMWRGEVDSVTVHDDDSNELIWQSSVSPGVDSLRYGAITTLTPGRTYIWSLGRNNRPLVRQTFQLVSTEEQGRLAQNTALLAVSRTVLDSLADADYIVDASRFSSLGLWSDMLTSLELLNLPGVDSRLTALGNYRCMIGSN
ncbi:MAG: hypothetical protein AAGB01_03540 [Cyanobacteria bacterium P01_F01_bin.42]